MRSRQPWALYGATLISSGYFGFAWLVMLMSDINQREGRVVFPRAISAGLCLAVIAYLVIIIVVLAADFSPETALFLVDVALALLGTFVVTSAVLVVFIAKYIARRAGKRFRLEDALLLIPLFLFGMLALPILQGRLNALTAGHSDNPKT